MMSLLTQLRLPRRMAAVILMVVAGSAVADTIDLDAAGEFDLLDAGFDLQLSFDTPVRSSFELQGIDSTGFFADRWSLDLLDDDGTRQTFSSTTNPDARASAVYTGFVRGVLPSQTELQLLIVGPDGILADLTFIEDGLNPTFFSSTAAAGFDLAADPESFGFARGSVLYPDTGSSLLAPIDLATVSASRTTLGDPDGNPLAMPSAVPSPSALGGGLLLLSYLTARRRKTA